MLLFVLTFMLGDLYLQSFSQLPSKKLIIITIIISAMCFVYLRRYQKYLILPFGFVIGFTWTAWYAASVLSWTLAHEMEGKVISVQGYVAALPNTDTWQTHFLFAIDHSLIKLSWQNQNKQIKVGDHWQLYVKLKRIHSPQNPGAFDFEAWALQKGLRATGYVVENNNNRLLSHAWYRYPIEHFRQNLQKKMLTQLPHSQTASWLMALIIGERSGIAQEDWQVLRNTGTNHLMAIGGLHIGVIAGFAHFLFAWLWKKIPKSMLFFPAHLCGSLGALIVALIYSALAGFSIPTQRACIMLFIFNLAALSRRNIQIWHVWSLALLIVLLSNPLSILTESFWLSFGTIALIIYGMQGRLAPTGWWWKWGRIQWIIGVGLIPLTLILFQQCSLISFIANSIAIPWLALLILPFCFLSGIFIFIAPSISHLLLIIADTSLTFLWSILTWLSRLNIATWQNAIPNYSVAIFTVIAIILLLLPKGFPGRLLGIFWFMPLFFYKPIKPFMGEYWMTVLDVGQGLSVVVQTYDHILVFDAGPKLNANFDMGESIVLPYLFTNNIKKIDMLVISHGDNDHVGGAQALLHKLSVLSVQTSVPEMLPSPVTHECIAGHAWEWDQVHFTFLHPSANDIDLNNDASCVLRVDNGKGSVLLTGDIEKYAEKKLLARGSQQLKVDILVAPHHGSKTSGLNEFISAVHPQFVLYATGYRNRYHFPHPTVVKSYTKINATQVNTADAGAIMFKFNSHGITNPQLYRNIHKRYWLD